MANAVVRGSLISIGLAGALCALAVEAAGGSGSFVVPGSKADQLTSCVAPTEFMRRNHMELIKHQRDETVHNGIRATDYSLAGCVDCHVSFGDDKNAVPVDADDQFCESCHEFAAVELNCFDCHATVPAYTDAEKIPAVAAHHDGDLHPSFALTLPGAGLQPAMPGEGNRP